MAPIEKYVFIVVGTSPIDKPPVKFITMGVIVMSRDEILNQVRIEEPDMMDDVTEFKDYLQANENLVCLVAHNGQRFQFPILKAELLKHNVTIPNHVVCADSLRGIYEVIEHPQNIPNDKVSVQKEQSGSASSSSGGDAVTLVGNKKDENISVAGKSYDDILHDPFFAKLSISEKRRYNELHVVHERVVNGRDYGEHAPQRPKVKRRCEMLAETAVKLGPAFLRWIDNNHCLFADVSDKYSRPNYEVKF